MKSYTKPTIALLAVNNQTGSVFCDVQADIDLIKDIIGDVNMDAAFGLNEACANQVPIDWYCKFTSAEMGAAQAFTS